jgi:predicted nucleic acid-binding protein
MNSTFLDTSFLLALASESDELHHRALAWKERLRGPFLISDFIFLEVGDSFALPEDRSLALSMIDDLESSPQVEIVRANPAWFNRGLQLFRKRLDKAWALTDCISFEIMREFGLTDALTHDHHFEQAGFRALLREDPPSN